MHVRFFYWIVYTKNGSVNRPSSRWPYYGMAQESRRPCHSSRLYPTSLSENTSGAVQSNRASVRKSGDTVVPTRWSIRVSFRVSDAAALTRGVGASHPSASTPGEPSHLAPIPGEQADGARLHAPPLHDWPTGQQLQGSGHNDIRQHGGTWSARRITLFQWSKGLTFEKRAQHISCRSLITTLKHA